MAQSFEPVESLLHCLQEAAKRHKTNAYQIAKATGLPLRSIQTLLAQRANPTLKNVHAIFDGLGMTIFIQNDHAPKIKPGRSDKQRRG